MSLEHPPPPAASPRTVDELYVELRERILKCEMAPGSYISQVQLARTLEVHRSALREALRMLQREGLIEGEYNHRVRIAPLSSTQLEQLYALRIVEESLALQLSVPRFSAEQLDRLDWLLEAMEEHADPASFAARQVFHSEFHAILVSESGQRIARGARELQDHCGRYRRAQWS
jgi:DNA-binding GntR family transcriptional regulator